MPDKVTLLTGERVDFALAAETMSSLVHIFKYGPAVAEELVKLARDPDDYQLSKTGEDLLHAFNLLQESGKLDVPTRNIILAATVVEEDSSISLRKPVPDRREIFIQQLSITE